ncbi:MAG: hypothetical protein WCF69_01450 [Mycobacterium sp.]
MSTAAYLRVSTGQQSIDQQHGAIAAAGITPDRVLPTPRLAAPVATDPPGWNAWAGFVKATTSWSSP